MSKVKEMVSELRTPMSNRHIKFNEPQEVLDRVYFGEYNFKKYYHPLLPPSSLNWLTSQMEKWIKYDWDQTALITGGEGSGKSMLGLEMCEQLDPGFPIDNIVFTEADFTKRIRQAEKGETIMLDEAGPAMFAYEWAKKGQIKLIKAFLQFRSKNLKIVLILPHAKNLNKNLRDRRVRWWLNVYVKSYKDRGYCKLKAAPLNQNEWEQRTFWEGYFALKFNDYKGPLLEPYQEKKAENLLKFFDDDVKTPEESKRVKIYRNRLGKGMKELKGQGWNSTDIGKIFGVKRRRVDELLQALGVD